MSDSENSPKGKITDMQVVYFVYRFTFRQCFHLSTQRGHLRDSG